MPTVKIPEYSYAWLIDQFGKAKEQEEKLASLPNQELFNQPAAEKWSAAECVAHLIQFGTIYYKRIDPVIEQADWNAATPPACFRPRFFWSGIIHLFEPPYTLKLKTISIFEPSQQDLQARELVFKKFIKLQNQFIDQLDRCQQKGINLKNEKIKNPAIPFLKMTLSESYGILLAHQRRHLWQAQQTLAKLQKN